MSTFSQNTQRQALSLTATNMRPGESNVPQSCCARPLVNYTRHHRVQTRPVWAYSVQSSEERTAALLYAAMRTLQTQNLNPITQIYVDSEKEDVVRNIETAGGGAWASAWRPQRGRLSATPVFVGLDKTVCIPMAVGGTGRPTTTVRMTPTSRCVTDSLPACASVTMTCATARRAERRRYSIISGASYSAPR